MKAQDDKSYHYTYSAGQQQELRELRAKYLPREETALEHLHRLDQSVTSRGTLWSIVTGTAGSLVLGLGMSMVMVWELFLPGVLVGCIGLAGVIAAYPLYLQLVKRDRARIAPEIIRLTNELLGE